MVLRVGIYGDTGMVGQEIERVLAHHDRAEIGFRQNSRRRQGALDECELVFLATKDPESMQFAPQALDAGARVIDMSGAFRLPRRLFEAGYGLDHRAPALLEEAVYGMPALFADRIAGARLVGNPGCYPTSVILALKPLEGMVQGEATVVATSGNSGARREVQQEPDEVTYSFGRRHKHVPEMEFYSGFRVELHACLSCGRYSRVSMPIYESNWPTDLKAFPPPEASRQLIEAIASAYTDEDLVCPRGGFGGQTVGHARRRRYA